MEEYRERMKEAITHLEFCCDLYKIQLYVWKTQSTRAPLECHIVVGAMHKFAIRRSQNYSKLTSVGLEW